MRPALASWRPAAALLAAMLWSAAALAQTLQPLSIQTARGRQDFSVEFANNDAERAQGLMFRRSLAADRGMLFDFGTVQPVSMWMQNTYIALDMLFIRADGTIARIAENTVPFSEEGIPSNEPVGAVLELVGGRTGELGIAEGDKVTWAK